MFKEGDKVVISTTSEFYGQTPAGMIGTIIHAQVERPHTTWCTVKFENKYQNDYRPKDLELVEKITRTILQRRKGETEFKPLSDNPKLYVYYDGNWTYRIPTHLRNSFAILRNTLSATKKRNSQQSIYYLDALLRHDTWNRRPISEQQVNTCLSKLGIDIIYSDDLLES